MNALSNWSISPTASRESLIKWLQYNDPNGSYSDRESELENRDPLTVGEAWRLIAEQVEA